MDPLLAQKAARNVVWAKKNQALLAALYPGKWVAIRDESVVAVADTEEQCDGEIWKRRLAQDIPVTIMHMVDIASTSAIIIGKQPQGLIKGTFGAASPHITVPPWVQKRAPTYASCQLVCEDLADLQYRSVSFDLHGTLVHPRQGWNLRIWAAFRKVLRKYGCADIPGQLEQLFGESGAADFVAKVAKKYYQRGAPLSEEFPEMFQDPRLRWSVSNTYALAELIAGDPCNVAVLKRRVGFRIGDMGIEVHEHISGSDSGDWYTTEEQRAVIESAISRGLLVMILSNGSYSSVAECTKRYFPEIPPWQVLTPEVLRGKGKPGPANAVLLLFCVGCAIVRNAIEGHSAPAELVAALPKKSKRQLRDEWKKSRAKIRAWLDEQALAAPDQAIGALRQGLMGFCAEMGIDTALVDSLLTLPHQHLHVGNSEHHDALPIVGLSLPFPYLLYAPEAPPLPKE